jgi:phosphoheptose isomerase
MGQGLFTMGYNIAFDIDNVATMIANCRGIVYTCGNGGSSSAASHFTQDLIKACGIKSICITDNVPFITATANDDSYDNIFRNFMELFWTAQDLLVLISGSGNSVNLLKVTEAMRGKVKTIAIVGFDGGELKNMVDYVIHVPISDMRKAEDKHIQVLHEIIDRIGDEPIR